MPQNFSDLFFNDEFVGRHLGSEDADRAEMLNFLGFSSLDAFVADVVPESVRLQSALDLPEPMTETDALEKLRAHANQIQVKSSYIGMGYHPTKLPAVIQRNLLENPGWYTAYTPYQAEIAQGRLEALLNFQQMCIDLTGLPLAGASLLDEATAAAEAMAMARRLSKTKTNAFFVDSRLLPQTVDVIRTRATYFGFELVFGTPSDATGSYFGAIFAQNGSEGDVLDLTGPIARVKAEGAVVAVVSDILSLMLLKSPGSMGADIALGSTQRFGVPMGFGGPHAAYFAFTDAAKRSAPGRMIGVSIDAHGNQALRMALQTREQHIRR